MNFREDINGLRCFAVVFVVLFHFAVPGFAGGFVGVDVFFVISGYLMTSIIAGKIRKGDLSIVAFYADRLRRIMPALAAMCATLLVSGWFMLFPEDYKALGKQAVAALVFLSNIVFNRDSGYFNASHHETWLLHTWSLSVEWQFYLIYPVVLAVMARLFRKESLPWVIAVLTVASLAWSVYASAATPTAAFYLLPSRAWEMLAGGLVFAFPARLSTGQGRMLEGLGFAMILYAVLCFDANDIWPGWLACVPVAGTVLVLQAARGKSFMTSNWLAQQLGKASYSIYLWHWPLVVGLHYIGKSKEPAYVAAAVGLSILAGFLSLHLIEHPAQKAMRAAAQRSGARQTLPYGLTGIAGAACGLGAIVFLGNGIGGDIRAINDGERARFVASYVSLHRTGLARAYRAECDFYDWQAKTAKSSISADCTGPAQPAWFLWGDSHAQALSLGLRGLASPNGVMQVATSGCNPRLGLQTARSTIDNNCDRSNAYALSEIARTKPHTVVIAQRERHEETDWHGLAAHLRGLGVQRVVLMGPLPAWEPSLPLVVARRHWYDRARYIKDGLNKASLASDALLAQRYTGSTTLQYVSLTQSLCKTEGCLAFVPGTGQLMAVDYAHLSPLGSEYAAGLVLSALAVAPGAYSAAKAH